MNFIFKPFEWIILILILMAVFATTSWLFAKINSFLGYVLFAVIAVALFYFANPILGVAFVVAGIFLHLRFNTGVFEGFEPLDSTEVPVLINSPVKELVASDPALTPSIMGNETLEEQIVSQYGPIVPVVEAPLNYGFKPVYDKTDGASMI